MKYAIISDIHGNNHALKAVLADAKAQNVNMYLFIGDYATSFPRGNDVVNAIRQIKCAAVIRGNGEDYFTALKRKQPGELIHEQFKPVYWAYRALSPGNLSYLINLPEKIRIFDDNFQINLAHSMNLFYSKPYIDLFWSRHYRARMEKLPFTHEEYLQLARESFLSAPGTIEKVRAIPAGVYLFGHNHLQFHMEYEGRLFVNPGSCGEPLDWDTLAAYTILHIDNNVCKVQERRVEYDIRLVVDELDTSGFSEYAPVWSKIMKREAKEAKDYFAPFVNHLIETGEKMGEFESPVSNLVWEEAVKTWNKI